jgi:hypothetical protein
MRDEKMEECEIVVEFRNSHSRQSQHKLELAHMLGAG